MSRHTGPPQSRRNQPEHIRVAENPCNLTNPAEWYSTVRQIKRRVVFHVGPTNSGKTHSALEAFWKAKSGIYCCPLRLLATEVSEKSNHNGIDCDLITGEVIKLVHKPEYAAHMACTVQMCDMRNRFNVAVIDEIQMIVDPENGWAYTKALLGLMADELHVCGDESVVELVNKLIMSVGETPEILVHKRPTPLNIDRAALGELSNAQDGDCIVCFKKKDIRYVVRELERLGKKTAKIYGVLPPDTKRRQAEQFNDPNNPRKIMVATDAVGLGLNLNIRRIVFYSLMKTTTLQNGQKRLRQISPNLAKHIAGRAGRQFTKYKDTGLVATMRPVDMERLDELMNAETEMMNHAGLRPTEEHMENFLVYWKRKAGDKATLDSVLKLYIEKVQVDRSSYFLCSMDNVLEFAEGLSQIGLSLNDLFVFANVPIQSNSAPGLTILTRMAKRFALNKQITADWLKEEVKWEQLQEVPISVTELDHYEEVFAICLHGYRWLSNKYHSLFPHRKEVDQMLEHLTRVIDVAVDNMHNLIDLNSRSQLRQPPRTSARRGRYRQEGRRNELHQQQQQEQGGRDDSGVNDDEPDID